MIIIHNVLKCFFFWVSKTFTKTLSKLATVFLFPKIKWSECELYKMFFIYHLYVILWTQTNFLFDLIVGYGLTLRKQQEHKKYNKKTKIMYKIKTMLF